MNNIETGGDEEQALSSAHQEKVGDPVKIFVVNIDVHWSAGGGEARRSWEGQ